MVMRMESSVILVENLLATLMACLSNFKHLIFFIKFVAMHYH